MRSSRWIVLVILLAAVLISDVSSKKKNKKKFKGVGRMDRCECGVPSAITNVNVDGEPHQKYPWLVNLMDKTNNMTTFCVGTIVSETLVLASASCLLNPPENSNKHCTNRKESSKPCFRPHSEVAIGIPVTMDSVNVFRKAQVHAKKIISHPQSARSNNVDEDLVLLKVSPAFKCKHASPICLSAHKLMKTWSTGIISGWKNETLKKESGNLTDAEIRQDILHSRECTKIQGHRASKQAVVCPLKNESAQYCKGDAGAPVFVPVHGKFHLVGVMSKGVIDDDCEKHEMFPLICVNTYLKWIHKMIKKEEKINYGRRFSTDN